MNKEQLKASIMDALEPDDYSVDELQGCIVKYYESKGEILDTDRVIKIAAECCGVRISEVKNKRGKFPLPLARGLVFLYYRTKTKFPLAKIGAIFNKDHSTVVHALNIIIQNAIDTNDPISKPMIDKFKAKTGI